MEIKTKFNLCDIVYLLSGSEIIKGRIDSIEIMVSESAAGMVYLVKYYVRRPNGDIHPAQEDTIFAGIDELCKYIKKRYE